VNFAHIRRKTLAVLTLRKDVDAELLRDADVAGPLAFCVAFGTCLLLAGKLHFDYVYGFGALGCVGMWAVVNLMAPPDRSLDVVGTFSIMGYCLLPLVGLAAVAVVLPLQSAAGGAAGAAAVAWATLASARFFEVALGMSEHRWLLAYPAALLFAAFALITIF